MKSVSAFGSIQRTLQLCFIDISVYISVVLPEWCGRPEGAGEQVEYLHQSQAGLFCTRTSWHWHTLQPTGWDTHWQHYDYLILHTFEHIVYVTRSFFFILVPQCGTIFQHPLKYHRSQVRHTYGAGPDLTFLLQLSSCPIWVHFNLICADVILDYRILLFTFMLHVLWFVS